MLRTIVLRMMVRIHHPDVLGTFKMLHEAEVRKESVVEPSDRLIVYSTLVATADEDGIKNILRVIYSQINFAIVWTLLTCFIPTEI